VPTKPAASPAAGATATTAAKPAATATGAAKPAATATGAAKPAAGPPRIPHTLEGRDNCATCHTVGGAGVGAAGGTGMPNNHQGRGNDTCRGCHSA
jgi:hypothetical protein